MILGSFGSSCMEFKNVMLPNSRKYSKREWNISITYYSCLSQITGHRNQIKVGSCSLACLTNLDDRI